MGVAGEGMKHSPDLVIAARVFQQGIRLLHRNRVDLEDPGFVQVPGYFGSIKVRRYEKLGIAALNFAFK
jgi:hypothetical protein